MYNKMLTSAIKRGDIFLSKLYTVTNALGIYFIWRYEKSEDNDKTQ